MTTLFTKLLIYTLVCINESGLTTDLVSEDDDTFQNVFDFTDKLKNNSDNINDYVTKSQAIFCPGQPICSFQGGLNSTDILKLLPQVIEIGPEVIGIEDIHEVIGACCLPCSCNPETCVEDGNCCLTKIFEESFDNQYMHDDQNEPNVFDYLDNITFTGYFEENYENATEVYSECIKASWLSYGDKDDIAIANDLDIPAYFMITQCFKNHSNNEDVAKCQTPQGYDDDDDGDYEHLVPISSLDTGRIYWNSYCARCNNDDRNILHWQSVVKFNVDIAYFVNFTRDDRPSYPSTYHDILQFISRTGNILFTPPVSQYDKLCLKPDTVMTCNVSPTKSIDPWLKTACERFYSPLIVDSAGRRVPFLNIFCYLCRRQHVKPSARQQCGYIDSYSKLTLKGMSALLDTKALDESDRSLVFGPRHDVCSCDEVYDTYMHYCRRIHCPPGDFMVNCRCIQPFKRIYGMAVLLAIKLIPRANRLPTFASSQIQKYRKSLKKILHGISENITVDLIGLLECKANASEYYLSLVIVRSLPGFDTKQAIRPFIEYLDNKRRNVRIVVAQRTFTFHLTSRVRLWAWNDPEKDILLSDLRDLDVPLLSHNVLFKSNGFEEVFDQVYQVLSPLLYCPQIQLNNTEFEEHDGYVIILGTSRDLTLSYYRRTSQTTIQVCVDHYMRKSGKSAVVKISHSTFCIFIVWILLWAVFVI